MDLSMIKICSRKMQMVMLLFLASCCCIQAQKKSARKNRNIDTLAGLNAFIQVSNIYQQSPLFLDMEWKNSTNFQTSEADTTTIQAVFYMKPGISYIRLNDAEQMVNDSMALLVSDKLQRMVLYSDAQPVLQHMKTVLRRLAGDSSVQQLAKKYKAQLTSPDQQMATIALIGRELVYGTSLPKESVEMQYDTRTKEPLQVITTRRTLIRITEENYKILSSDASFNGLLQAPEEKGYFVVKEQTATFTYKTIKHDADMKLPAGIADRLTRNETGGYVPVKKYEQYAVTYN
jgi:hypothetical protein